MVPSAIGILASVLLLQCCSSQKQEETFKGEVGHRDERCPLVNPKVAKLLPHDEECTQYYICESGFAIERECPDNLHFNPKKLVCDFADRAGCELEQSSPRLRAEGFEHPDCPAKNPKKPVLLPDPSDCGRFFICDGGVAHPKTCQAGLHFNPKVKVCDFPGNVDCGTEEDHGQERQGRLREGGGDRVPEPLLPPGQRGVPHLLPPSRQLLRVLHVRQRPGLPLHLPGQAALQRGQEGVRRPHPSALPGA